MSQGMIMLDSVSMHMCGGSIRVEMHHARNVLLIRQTGGYSLGARQRERKRRGQNSKRIGECDHSRRHQTLRLCQSHKHGAFVFETELPSDTLAGNRLSAKIHSVILAPPMMFKM